MVEQEHEAMEEVPGEDGEVVHADADDGMQDVPDVAGNQTEELPMVPPLGNERIPTKLNSPIMPSAEDVEAHNLTHLPCRNWYRV